MTTAPLLARSREELRAALGPDAPGLPVGSRAGRVALVPTMGALHEGHAALVRHARAAVEGPVVVSVFVNPTQFAPDEDLDRYPRTLEADLEVCREGGADVVFTPPVEEMYPESAGHAPDAGPGACAVTVDPGPRGAMLEGAFRPTHFRGVLTVVAKLFGLVRPGVAVFGEKDYQQLMLVRQMSADLCLGVDVLGAPTVREPDGLALSSRNRYLDADERRSAAVLSRALFAAREAAGAGPEEALEAARAELAGEPGVRPDYLELTDPDLRPAPASGPARLLVAARVGTTRLIDNLALDLGGR